MTERQPGHEFARGRLQAHPLQQVGDRQQPVGLQKLGLDDTRDGLLYVPRSYQVDRPAPLVLMLHGAGGTAHGGLMPLENLAEAYGLILLAPASRLQTWDIIAGRRYGLDVPFIDHALIQMFERYAVDPTRLAIEGFSDGASYALSLGLTNGELFTHIIAFSPGFMSPASRHGTPHIYISHGEGDTVLPIERCSRRVVPQLHREGYTVLYHEFTGFHSVPGEIAHEAVRWFLGNTDES